MAEECGEDVKDVLREVKRAFDGYDERGYYTFEEVKRVAEALSSWRTCMRLRER